MEHTSKSQNIISAPHERLMNIEHAAMALGLSRAALYRLAAAGEIPFVRLGRRVLIDPADLDALIARRKDASVHEVTE
jgi:excisionase family DNA binding protein